MKYPPEWKFEDEADGIAVPAALRNEVYSMIEKIARGANEEEAGVVESFKTRFGDANTSSSTSWAYSDLSTALASMKNAAEFAEAFWLGVEDARGKDHVVPTLMQVNKLYAKHDFPFRIEPPHLVRTDQPWKLAPAAPEAVLGATHEGPSKSHPAAEALPPAAPPAPTIVAALALPASPRSAVSSPSRPTCFVAQPFHEPFQGRFDEDIEPAIQSVGLVAYKVDKDLAADKLVEDIHAGIERASVVLVDITEDNPNVWYELGYSQALGKPLVMISCSTERGGGKAYPFDVRGRKVVDYQVGRVSYHQKLRTDVAERIKAILAREEQKPKGGQFTTPSPVLDDADVVTILESWMGNRTEAQNTSALRYEIVAHETGLSSERVTKHIEEAAASLNYKVRRKGTATILFEKESEIPF